MFLCYFALMKRSTIILLGILMVLSLVSLLTLQVRYIRQIVDMRKVHFMESVDRSVHQTVDEIEMMNGGQYVEDIQYGDIDPILRAKLHNNGIELKYHFKVQKINGETICTCPDYDGEGAASSFSALIFKMKPDAMKAVLKVHFPEFSNYISSSLRFIFPALIFTLLLVVAFIITLVMIFRQKRLSEMKNDFINNMTHEFKTPISTISLAAQMLNDENLKKTPQMVKRYSQTIMDEAKRLRFQVEKVLQVSIYENKKAKFNLRELDVNELVAGVIHTFAIRVERTGGKIISNLKAEDPIICADDMHITNVLFNLMDNAMKYRREDAPLELVVSTWNEADKLCVSIQDNGIGIKKENLKRIFEKFYRVHTGNVHNVKGFGLGLAYVSKIIKEHQGVIHAESELGIGTKFIIKLPTIKD